VLCLERRAGLMVISQLQLLVDGKTVITRVYYQRSGLWEVSKQISLNGLDHQDTHLRFRGISTRLWRETTNAAGA
jgi:hypothetical protein